MQVYCHDQFGLRDEVAENHKTLKTNDIKVFKKKECGESTEFYFYEGVNLGIRCDTSQI